MVAWLFNRFSHLINTAKERLIYSLSFLFLTLGHAIFFRFSILLSCMFFGAVLVNSNRTSFEFFNSLREIDARLYLIFFVLAGASLKIRTFGQVLLVASIGFIIFRTAGKIVGAFYGAKLVDVSGVVRKYIGLALLPQAGIALGCALVAKHTLNNYWRIGC